MYGTLEPHPDKYCLPEPTVIAGCTQNDLRDLYIFACLIDAQVVSYLVSFNCYILLSSYHQ